MKDLRVIGSNEFNVAVLKKAAVRRKWLHLASFKPSVGCNDILEYVGYMLTPVRWAA